MFTCIKSLNRYNLRHNNCVIFSIFLYFKYSFLSNSFIYKFVHAIIFSLIEKKSYQLLICRVAKNLSVVELLNNFIKSSTVAYKRVTYKKNLVYFELKFSLFIKFVPHERSSIWKRLVTYS